MPLNIEIVISIRQRFRRHGSAFPAGKCEIGIVNLINSIEMEFDKTGTFMTILGLAHK